MSEFGDFGSFDNTLGGAFAVVGNGGARFSEMNKGITPIFFTEEIEDTAATEAAGTLKMKQVERVRLVTAGDMNSAPVHPINDEIRQRFPEQYARWKSTQTNDFIDGTPLSAWPQASRGLVMELAAVNIRSVEDLAAVADTNLHRISEGRVLRAKAQAWLATNKDSAKAAEYAAKFERQSAELEALKQQVRELAAQIQHERDEKRGPGRPRTAA